MRKILIAVALFASTAYVACGGGGEEAKPPVTPTVDSASAMPAPTPTPSAEPAMSAAPSASVTASAEPPKPKSLFDRLGGKDAIAKVVDAALKNITEDKRINKFFAKTVKDPKKVDALKQNLVDQICQATGGPCEYKGKDMKTAHKGMKIKEADFQAFVEDVTKALDSAGVGATEKQELLDALGGMKGDIVEAGPAPKGAASGSAKPAGSAAKPAGSAKK
jgi:hemoglobin